MGLSAPTCSTCVRLPTYWCTPHPFHQISAPPLSFNCHRIAERRSRSLRFKMSSSLSCFAFAFSPFLFLFFFAGVITVYVFAFLFLRRSIIYIIVKFLFFFSSLYNSVLRKRIQSSGPRNQRIWILQWLVRYPINTENYLNSRIKNLELALTWQKTFSFVLATLNRMLPNNHLVDSLVALQLGGAFLILPAKVYLRKASPQSCPNLIFRTEQRGRIESQTLISLGSQWILAIRKADRARSVLTAHGGRTLHCHQTARSCRKGARVQKQRGIKTALFWWWAMTSCRLSWGRRALHLCFRSRKGEEIRSGGDLRCIGTGTVYIISCV